MGQDLNVSFIYVGLMTFNVFEMEQTEEALHFEYLECVKHIRIAVNYTELFQ
jgi:hypothetical protein